MTSTQVRAYLYIYDVQQERRLPIEAYGLSRIGITTPACTIPTAALQHFAELELADSEFGTPGSVDAILGADVWSNIVLPSMIFRGGVVAQSTIFGWAITGTIKINRHN
uniref:Peptidase aspartic putative domain-containing protein n=1 Tax=Trichogramma kaykai TaxID=54128 RepID=A0ABD2X7N4_9HYME